MQGGSDQLKPGEKEAGQARNRASGADQLNPKKNTGGRPQVLLQYQVRLTTPKLFYQGTGSEGFEEDHLGFDKRYMCDLGACQGLFCREIECLDRSVWAAQI